ncbi:nucleoside diphosphate kinase [Absidia repens]|uniref:Nucleoside diphosphate kinase n=1 Tax=Absidia repens TaxID=90262 RepID=A0A1X2ITX9_9FUNG|nr:nucleoside diphosphate kinase [Absidia repens]
MTVSILRHYSTITAQKTTQLRTTQLTLALLKPDICADKSLIPKIQHTMAEHQLDIVQSRDVLWTEQEAGRFYAEHEGKFFYHRLCGYMTSGPFQAYILSSSDAIKKWRSLIGPTHPVRARIHQPDTLRALYGLTDTRNSFHGSGKSFISNWGVFF